jgi:hypothetical protein
MFRSNLRENYDILCRFCLEKSNNERKLYDRIHNNARESSQIQTMGLKVSRKSGMFINSKW